jgi:hypothetical protein
MNLNNYIKQQQELIDIMEDMGIDFGPSTKQYHKEQRKTFLELQIIMMKALEKEYPCHGITYIPDMYEYYDFNITVTPKVPK